MFKRRKWFHNSKKVEIDWYKFDSKLEWDYYLYLKKKKEEWMIKDFELQPRYELQEKFEKLWKKYKSITYIADFKIILNWYKEIVVDIKGLPTETANLKRKLFDYKYRDLKLVWIQRYKWDWVIYEDNQKRIKENKKNKKELEKETKKTINN